MKKESCCQKNNNSKGIISGILYGLIPHSFCIAFILFSVMGAVAGATIMGKFLLIPYFFQALIVLSMLFATLSAVIYLNKQNALSLVGIRKKWKYLTLMYSTTIIVNVLIFFVVFPAVANINNTNDLAYNPNLSSIEISAQIPCSGHAPLIIGELKKENGIGAIFFKMPNIFTIKYDPTIISPEKITSLDVFNNYKATIQ